MKKFSSLNAHDKLKWATKEKTNTILTTLNTNLAGLDNEEVEKMRDIFGVNSITKRKEKSVFQKFLIAFVNPFTSVLFGLAIISYIIDVHMAPIEDKDWTAVVIIGVMVFLSGILRFLQERSSENAVNALSEMVETTVLITREGKGAIEIPVDEVVVGDIITLNAGDIIPADVRLIQTKDLFVSQSSLTGESEPIEKFAVDIIEDTQPLESPNLVFMGTNVVSGSAMGVVIVTGDDTMLGQIAKDLNKDRPITSFEKGVNDVSKVLIMFMMIMVPFIFLINGLIKGEWLNSFMFSLAIAVGLTPEMLPMIVSTNLAKGARKMASKKVIVKDLNAIQDFGAMDILCTDKTGTLTEDKIVLEYYYNSEGEEDKEVLKYAFLNSFHQTGLKNLIDVAIIKHKDNVEISPLTSSYKKIDEIPFDFNRRRMSVLVKNENYELVTKGAAEEMVEISSHIELGKKVVLLTEEIKKDILDQVKAYNSKGLRILGVSKKVLDKSECSLEDEKNMIFMGYLAFLDPPKATTEKALKALQNYNVGIKILTGDNDSVTAYVCSQVGLEIKGGILLGSDLAKMTQEEVTLAVEERNVFAKLSPSQKTLVVKTLRENGHTVGFMGDGINDAPATKEADVGISVDTATDIARESANIILLEKSLLVLEDGLIEGRKIYANIVKYIKMTASSNFGNMFSMMVVSVFIPFMPMTAIQILLLNLIYDVSCMAIPWDNVDEEFVKTPKKWDASSIKKFMIWIGPTSSVFDILTFWFMYQIMCPYILNVMGYHDPALDAAGRETFISIFQTAWFIVSLWTQTLVIYMLRTQKLSPQNRPSLILVCLTTLGIALGTAIPFTHFGEVFEMSKLLPVSFFMFLAATIVGYIILVSIVKGKFIRKYKEFL